MQSIPDAQLVAKAAQLGVLDMKGKTVIFGDLIKDTKTIVVFIRHFFCGACQAYVQQLASVEPTRLAKANVQIIIIGCGEWQPIATYKELAAFTGPIYADPSRALYNALGMNVENLDVTPKGQTRKSYLTRSGFAIAIQSIWGGLTHMGLIGKQGNFGQLGGEFIFGPGINCTFASRMQHTEDHTEINDLLKEAGVAKE